MGIHAFNRDARLARIYCDGVTAQKGGGVAGDNPWDSTDDADQYLAWANGFTDAEKTDAAAVDLSCCGYPAAGKESPELTGIRY